jgi:hypothetical protein
MMINGATAMLLVIAGWFGWTLGDLFAKKVKVKKLRKRIAEGYYDG